MTLGRPGELNQQPFNNKMMALPLSHIRPGEDRRRKKKEKKKKKKKKEKKEKEKKKKERSTLDSAWRDKAAI